MSELEPTPELPDKTPTREVRFPTPIKNALFAAGLKTVGEVRETSDEALLSLPDQYENGVLQNAGTTSTGYECTYSRHADATVKARIYAACLGLR